MKLQAPSAEWMQHYQERFVREGYTTVNTNE